MQSGQTCEVVQHPGALSSQGGLGLKVGLKKRNHSNHQVNVTYVTALGFYWAGRQKVSYTSQQWTDELQKDNNLVT